MDKNKRDRMFAEAVCFKFEVKSDPVAIVELSPD